jgi:hypothetical protein
MTDDDRVKRWATQQAARELHDAKQAGITPARQWHYGRAVVLMFEAGKHEDAPRMLAAGLTQTGSHGTQFVAGLRSAVTMLDGARGIQALDEAANVEAWTAQGGTSSDPDGAIAEEAGGL